MKPRTENRSLERGQEPPMNSHSLLCVLLFGLLGCLSRSSPGIHFGPPPPPAPAPVISSISPMRATAGGAAFTLTVNGSHFLSGADLVWRNPGNPGFFNGGEVTFVNSSMVTLQIPAGAIAIPGSVQIFVSNPDGSPDSNTVSFTIDPGPPGGANAISTGANGAAPNRNSSEPALSVNVRFIAFPSKASNLIEPT